MTEDEAKTKWCPFARYASHNGEGINRWALNGDVQLSPDPAKCIASACMAWRSSETPEFKARAEVAFRHDGIRLRQAADDVTGFCGLAGAPR